MKLLQWRHFYCINCAYTKYHYMVIRLPDCHWFQDIFVILSLGIITVDSSHLRNMISKYWNACDAILNNNQSSRVHVKIITSFPYCFRWKITDFRGNDLKYAKQSMTDACIIESNGCVTQFLWNIHVHCTVNCTILVAQYT